MCHHCMVYRMWSILAGEFFSRHWGRLIWCLCLGNVWALTAADLGLLPTEDPPPVQDLASLDILFSKLYYFSPGTSRRSKFLFEEQRFVNNTTGNSKHTCCPFYKLKPSSLSGLLCGYVLRYQQELMRYMWGLNEWLESATFMMF